MTDGQGTVVSALADHPGVLAVGNRVQRNVNIDQDLSRQITNAVEWIKDNHTTSYTASELFESALIRELRRLTGKFRAELPGDEFPEAPDRYIRRGRPPTGKI